MSEFQSEAGPDTTFSGESDDTEGHKYFNHENEIEPSVTDADKNEDDTEGHKYF